MEIPYRYRSRPSSHCALKLRWTCANSKLQQESSCFGPNAMCKTLPSAANPTVAFSVETEAGWIFGWALNSFRSNENCMTMHLFPTLKRSVMIECNALLNVIPDPLETYKAVKSYGDKFDTISSRKTFHLHRNQICSKHYTCKFR